MIGYERLMLDGRVGIVTGAALGMGRATAMLLAARGARVVVSDIREDAGEATVADIVARGGEAIFVRADVSCDEDVQALVARAIEAYGTLDIAVNNAAVAPDTREIGEADLGEVDRVLNVNLRSVLLCLRAEIAAMAARGRGAIVNIGSVSSARPQPGNPAYVAAKHGVIGSTKTAALDYAMRGIRVNAVLPGAIDTPMMKSALEEMGASADAVAPTLSLFGRLGKPEEVAEASCWLCSDAASFVTGHALAVDAGYLAR